MKYNIPKLPLDIEIETKVVLKQTIEANRRLAELKGVVQSMPLSLSIPLHYKKQRIVRLLKVSLLLTTNSTKLKFLLKNLYRQEQKRCKLMPKPLNVALK